MPSTPASKQTAPQGSPAVKSDADRAARADKTADKTSAKPAPDERPSAPLGQTITEVLAAVSAPSAKTMFRATAADSVKVPSDDRPAIGKWAHRARLGLLLAACSAIAAVGWARYGDAAKAMAVSFMPNYFLTAPSPQQQPETAEQPTSPALQAEAAAPGEPAAPSAPGDGLAPESVQLLQSMSQQIEQLKASVEELRTGQEQLSRDVAETRTALARTSEQNPRPMMLAGPLSPAAAPARKPKPAAGLPQTAAAAATPSQPGPRARAAVQPRGEPVLRPPMPIRPTTAFP
jgi:hypothetical protein